MESQLFAIRAILTMSVILKVFAPLLSFLAAACAAASANEESAAPTPGEALFLANCAECHQRDGQGLANIYPALDGSEVVRGSGIDVALVLIIGRGEMPSFKGALSAEEMAAVINYVRNAWSNEGEAVSAEAIEKLQ